MELELINFKRALPEFEHNGFTWRNQWFDSSACLYVPWYAGFTGKTVELDLGEKLLMWQKPFVSTPAFTAVYKSIPEMFTDNLFVTTMWNAEHKYQVSTMKGLLYITDSQRSISHPLMALAVRGDYLFTMDKNRLDKTRFALMWNYELLSDRRYNPLKRVLTPFITEARLNRMNLIETTDINQWIFQSSFKVPIFKTTKEHRDFQEQTKDIIYEQ